METSETVDVIGLVAERKILEAMAEGQFDNLPGRGRPLPPDEDGFLPEELRLVATILKNSGYAGEEEPSLCQSMRGFRETSPVGAKAFSALRTLGLKFSKGRKIPLSEKVLSGEERAERLIDSPYLEAALSRLVSQKRAK
jgi:hypothetical protein